jgi:hypothetical protein
MPRSIRDFAPDFMDQARRAWANSLVMRNIPRWYDERAHFAAGGCR